MKSKVPKSLLLYNDILITAQQYGAMSHMYILIRYCVFKIEQSALSVETTTGPYGASIL